jgi:hypothetical protein
MRAAFSLAASALLVVPCMAAAQQDTSGRRPQGPPPEAVAACIGQSAGASVSFSRRDGGSMQGVCEWVDGKLAARPSGMPPRGGEGGGPPPTDSR